MPLLKYYNTTTSQWLPILAGAKGDTGDIGPQGVQGEPGADGALQLIKAESIGTAVSSVTVNDAFSADYDNYKIMMAGGFGSAALALSLQIGASVTGYNYVRRNIAFSGGAETLSLGNNLTGFNFSGSVNTSLMFMNLEIGSPFLSNFTTITGSSLPSTNVGTYNGFHQVAASYSSFTVNVSGGTMTGGAIYLYGYKK
jgi:hypothetical protein